MIYSTLPVILKYKILPFILNYKYIFLFYLVIIVLLLIKRKKIEVQAKFILLYRTKFGLKLIEKVAEKKRELVILFGYIGVGAGYLGMVFISVYLVISLIQMITAPGAVTGASLVYPGMEIPGLGVLSFWQWLLIIFIIAAVHEFSHGIVARAHKIPVKNTGIVFLGPIIGAFVEPNEDRLRKESDVKQYSVLAAGSFSNMFLALLAFLLLGFVFLPMQQTMEEPTGFSFEEYYGEISPMEQAGVPPRTLIKGVDGEETKTFTKFDEKLSCFMPDQKINLMTEKGNFSLVLGNNPDNPGKALLGIKNIRNEVKEKEQGRWGKFSYSFVSWMNSFLRWLFLLSLGIGLFNLLPLPLIDGGRMLQVYLHKKKGKEKGERRYKQITILFLLVLVLNLIYSPLLKVLKSLFGV